MIIKVIRAFLDKCDDLKKREIGEEIEVDEHRAKSLIERGFAEEAKDPIGKPKKPTGAKSKRKTSE